MAIVLQILTLFGALGMFLYGMTLMSEGLQKAAGDKMRSILASMTSNPFKSVLTGLFITALIQSSSATTVMVVSFVNASLLTLTQAVGVIMGANIGTTVTAWLISLLGFKADISVLSVPLMAVGFILSISKKASRKNYGEFVVGFALLFLGLTFLKDSVPDLRESPQVLEFLKQWTGYGFGSVLLFLGIGTVLTILLQSSSATMALTLVMVNFGWIPFPMAAALVLGENIGTTITANIAAAVANASAKRAARAHTVFNVFGVIWAMALFMPFLDLVSVIVTSLGLPDPLKVDMVALKDTLDSFTASGADADTVARAEAAVTAGSTAVLYGVSFVHTLFNLINTTLLVWFIPLIVKFVTWLVKDKAVEDDSLKLQYIQAGPWGAPELSLEEAKQEIVHFAEICKKDYAYVRAAVKETDSVRFDEIFNRVSRYEEITDRLEFEIASYLNKVSETGEMSEESSRRLRAMYKIIGEMESLGDSAEAIGRILRRMHSHNKSLDAVMLAHIDEMLDLVDNALDSMIDNIKAGYRLITDIENAFFAEKAINDCRNRLREAHVNDIENGKYDYLSGSYYMDIILELERVGDFIINVSEAVLDIKKGNKS